MAIKIESIIPESTEFYPPLKVGEIITDAKSFLIYDYPSTGKRSTVAFICRRGQPGGAVSIKEIADGSGGLMKVDPDKQIFAGPLKLRGI